MHGLRLLGRLAESEVTVAAAPPRVGKVLGVPKSGDVHGQEELDCMARSPERCVECPEGKVTPERDGVELARAEASAVELDQERKLVEAAQEVVKRGHGVGSSPSCARILSEQLQDDD